MSHIRMLKSNVETSKHRLATGGASFLPTVFGLPRRPWCQYLLGKLSDLRILVWEGFFGFQHSVSGHIELFPEFVCAIEEKVAFLC